MSITWTADDYAIEVAVETEDGAPVDLAGATAEAWLGRNTTVVAAQAIVTDAAAGLVNVSIADGMLAPGVWTLQVRVTIGAETQTVYDDGITVRRSLTAAA